MFSVWDVMGTPAHHDWRKVNSVLPAKEPQAFDEELLEAGHLPQRRQSGERAARTWKEAADPPAQPRRERALLASQIMTTPVRQIRQDTTLLQAWQILQAARFRHLPVVNEGGFLVGILSERDLLREAGTPDHHPLRPVAGRPVSEIMRTRVFTARPEAPIRDLARLMIAENIGAVPIFDQGPGLDGIVTRGDVMRTLVHEAPLELWI